MASGEEKRAHREEGLADEELERDRDVDLEEEMWQLRLTLTKQKLKAMESQWTFLARFHSIRRYS